MKLRFTGLRKIFSRNPFLLFSLSVLSAILLSDSLVEIPLWIPTFFTFILFLSLFRSFTYWKFSLFLFLFAFSLHGFRVAEQRKFLEQSQITSQDSRWVKLNGKIIKIWGKKTRGKKAIFLVNEGVFNERNLVGKGKLLLSSLPRKEGKDGKISSPQRGEEIEIEGWAHLISEPRNPSFWDAKKYWHFQGIDLSLSSRKVHSFEEISSYWKFRNSLNSLSEYFKHSITRGIDETSEKGRVATQLILAMVLGDKSSLEESELEIFHKSGTTFFFVVSGLHVAILSLFLLHFLNFFPLSRAIRCSFLLCILFFYIGLCGFSPSSIRAFLMIALLFLASLFCYRSRTLNILGFSFVLCLLFNSRFLFSVGFQLSYLAVLAISLGMEKWKHHNSILFENPFVPELFTTSVEKSRKKFLKYLASSFVVSASAFLGTSPIIAWHFGVITPSVILASIFLYPLVYASLLLAFFSALIGGISSPLNEKINQWNGKLVLGIHSGATFFSKLPKGYYQIRRLKTSHTLRIYDFKYQKNAFFLNAETPTFINCGSRYNMRKFLSPIFEKSQISPLLFFTRFGRSEKSTLKEWLRYGNVKLFLPKKIHFLEIHEKKIPVSPLKMGEIYKIDAETQIEALLVPQTNLSSDINDAILRIHHKNWTVLLMPKVDALLVRYLKNTPSLLSKSDFWILPQKMLKNPSFAEWKKRVQPKAIIFLGRKIPSSNEKNEIFLSKTGAIDLNLEDEVAQILSPTKKKTWLRIER